MEGAVETLGGHGQSANRWIGVYISALAGLLAIGNVGGENAAKEAVRNNILASDTWAFYQAKHIRSTSLDIAADALELSLVASPALPAAAVQQVRERVDTYRAHAERLNSDPVKQEGMKELRAKAESLERERDRALRRDPYFDWCQAMLQIAIVLASVRLIVGNRSLLALSAVLGGVGVLFMLNGYLLVVRLPLFG
jgi:hypothetical protein